jgi:hypothetical protein
MDDREWLTGAIERNCDALLRIAATLFAILRLPGGGMAATLPRHLYFHVLRVLRPAESAVRRLVILEAIGLEVPAKEPAKGAVAGSPRKSRQPAGKCKPEAVPAFQIFEPFKPLPSNPWIDDDAGDGPPAFPRPVASPDEPLPATQLCRRLKALIGALDDLPAQARRLARWRLNRARPRRWTSLRPGFPPGYRRRARHEVDEVLRECRRLVAWAQSPPGSR